ncbi:hypothetical protein [Leucobacter sp. G161]|uniref:hypothetical protein n=1 Tax=Leucobacter sp. G161 TaxID=663704 RepID=UPI00137979C8|nr:hypothetical protein [Leucobacter sp. G161]
MDTTPTAETIATDLELAMHAGSPYGYEYDGGNTVTVEVWDDFTIVKTYTATITIKENN